MVIILQGDEPGYAPAIDKSGSGSGYGSGNGNG